MIYLFVPFGILDTVSIPELPMWTNSTIRSYDFLIIPKFDNLTRFLMHFCFGFMGGAMVFVLLFAETAMVEYVLFLVTVKKP